MIRPHLSPLSAPPGRDPGEAGLAASEGSALLFRTLFVYHDIDSRPAALNMAIDEALLENAARPSVRFYRWSHPALSFGYFGRFTEVANYERDIVRRWTGGGTVFHGEDLTYSIVVPANDLAFREPSMSIYEKVHRAVRAAFAPTKKGDFQIAAALENRRPLNATATDRRDRSDLCFANPVRSDVLLNGRKIAGAAQRRTKRGLLQQGSIQNVDLPTDFTEQFAGQLSRRCQEQMVDQAILERAQQIADEKYATVAWLRRR